VYSHVFTDVSKLGNTASHPSSRLNSTIQGLQSYLREATVEIGAMVNTVKYEGMDMMD